MTKLHYQLLGLFTLVAAFVGIGLGGYYAYPESSATVAEVTAPATLLSFVPVDDPPSSIGDQASHSFIIKGQQPLGSRITGVEFLLTYPADKIEITKIESTTLTTTLSEPVIEDGLAAFSFGVAAPTSSDRVCPMDVDQNNSGSCVNNAGQCVSYTNGCMRANSCAAGIQACDNSGPLPFELARVTYNVLGGRNGITPGNVTIALDPDSILAVTDRNDNALSNYPELNFYLDALHPIDDITPPLAGDFNTDKTVDLLDFNLIVTQFNNPYSLIDFNLVITNFGKTSQN